MNETTRRQSLAALTLGAIGVVYGDIGTSPLYTMKEIFGPGVGLPLDAPHLIGAVSTIFWALMFVVTLKYVLLILRADNHGEGGIMALTALAMRTAGRTPRGRTALLLIGVFGAALFYGDSVITPAISVLGAAEGLEVVAPALKAWVLPISVGVLLGLFVVQRFGTQRVGVMFGPVIVLWFGTLAATGVWQIAQAPAILQALDPREAFGFLQAQGWHVFVVVGAVVLALTGAEALYADMGHFGARPIRLSWYFFVLPSLLLNYFGQGALVLLDPAAAEHPFFRLAPNWALPYFVGLSTLATVIASQAVISGAFSLTRQAVQLGYLPRVDIEHTSETESGQIYIPGLNWVLMIACIGLVIGFRSSSRLAAAYGVAVTTDMVFTTILFAVVARDRWKWSLAGVLAMASAFLVVDLGFWSASLLKIPSGGWFPLLIAGLVFTVMTTWNSGRGLLATRLAERSMSVEQLLERMRDASLVRVPGTAVYLGRHDVGVPPALLHNLRYNHVLHSRVVLLSMRTDSMARVPEEERLTVEHLTPDFYRVVARHGFAEDPEVPAVLERLRASGLEIDPEEATFFLGRETLLATHRPGMALWRERLFAVLARNARRATHYFRIPSHRVCELGAEIEL